VFKVEDAVRKRVIVVGTVVVVATLAVALVVALVVAIAGGEGDRPRPAADGQAAAGQPRTESANAGFNEQDVAFASNMRRYHNQAITMATLATTKAAAGGAREFAQGIQRSRQAEVRTLDGWLRSWGRTGPAAPSGADAEDAAAELPGLMAPEDLNALKGAVAGEFDWMFLTMMMEQEQGATAMADQEVAHGRHAAAVALARAIQQRRASETTTMQGLMGSS
jgi:uncharacterized protein (DUF305 family)